MITIKDEREIELMRHAGMLVSNVISQAGDSEDVYKMAIRYYSSHLRAWLVESPNLKNNRTVQNYRRITEEMDFGLVEDYAYMFYKGEIIMNQIQMEVL